MGQPVKIGDQLLLDARLMGEASHRSIAGQIEYWAKLGEAVEPLLQGLQVQALLRARKAKPLAELLESVETAKGRERLTEYLAEVPFPHYEAAPRRPGLLVRIEADGTRTVGRFVKKRFVAVH